MFFSLAISIVGLTIEYRILKNLDRHQIFTKKISQNWIFISSIAQVLQFIIFQSSNFVVLIVSLCKIFTPILFLTALEIRRQRGVRVYLVPAIDFLTLQIRSGRSLREAIDELLVSKTALDHFFQEVRSLIQFESDKKGDFRNSQLNFVAHEILEIHRSSFRVVDRLKALRNKIKIENDFRQKSRQVTGQIRMQAFILSLIYILLIILGVSEFQLLKLRMLLASSAFLFGLGLICLFLLPRTFRWKA